MHNDKTCHMPKQQFIIIKDMAHYELIIGLHDIRHYDLTGQLCVLDQPRYVPDCQWVSIQTLNFLRRGTETETVCGQSRQRAIRVSGHPSQTGAGGPGAIRNPCYHVGAREAILQMVWTYKPYTAAMCLPAVVEEHNPSAYQSIEWSTFRRVGCSAQITEGV